MPRLTDYKNSRYFSRELSWLSFNDRVLEEAADLSTPLLERIKYLAILSSNLEEFFMVRVAALVRLIKTPNIKKSKLWRDGYYVPDLLANIRLRAMEQKFRQAQVWEQFCLELARSGVYIEQKQSEHGKAIFEKEVLPLLKPIQVKKNAKIPLLRGGRIHFLARHKDHFSLIELPEELPRFFIHEEAHICLVDHLILAFQNSIFPQDEILEMFAFKISRDAEIDLAGDDDDFLEAFEEGLDDRNKGAVVRLEVDASSISPGVKWLEEKLEIHRDAVYQIDLPLDLKSLMPLSEIKTKKKFRYNYSKPRRPTSLKSGLKAHRFFKRIEENDQLLHHPFSSYDPIVDLLQFAAQDPKVKRICQTLYRSSKDSAALEALRQAAKNGKNVVALVEVKARFDERNNLKWARALEKAGAKVIYGTSDLKIHAKMTYIERDGRKAGDPSRHYVHVGTGNYHPITAKIYTDLGVMSSRKEYWKDAKKLFEYFELMDANEDYALLKEQSFKDSFKNWVVAPAMLREKIIEWIGIEAENAKKGKPAYIRAKMNGLVEKSTIEALYAASAAGVKIDLLVRGMCCLRPGVPGLSENIRVRSIIDKYLEHSRVFIFENAGKPKVWISSADWMPRNLFRRVELAVPIVDPAISEYICETYWGIYSADNMKSRECLPDGRYIRDFSQREKNIRAQFVFEDLEVPSFPKPSTFPKPQNG